jgi:fatty-acyl-CoA synthase
MAMNHSRHQLFVTARSARAGCFTINPRLFDDQLDYIVNHADRVCSTTGRFSPLVERLRERWPKMTRYLPIRQADPGVPGVWGLDQRA